MNRLLLVFVCSCSFLSQVFANDEPTARYETVYEMDQLEQTKEILLLEPLVQTNEIKQTAKEQTLIISQKRSHKITVTYFRQNVLSEPVPFTTEVMETFKQGKRPAKGRRPVLMLQTYSPTYHPHFHRLQSNKLLMGGAFIYDRSDSHSF